MPPLDASRVPNSSQTLGTQDWPKTKVEILGFQTLCAADSISCRDSGTVLGIVGKWCTLRAPLKWSHSQGVVPKRVFPRERIFVSAQEGAGQSELRFDHLPGCSKFLAQLVLPSPWGSISAEP